MSTVYHTCLTPPGLGFRFLPLLSVCVCDNSADSPSALGVFLGTPVSSSSPKTCSVVRLAFLKL